MNSPILSAQSISRKIETRASTLTILRDVNLEVSVGESIAIQGASGSGKSTLLAILAGLDIPQQGHVFFNNEDITRLDEDQRAVLRADSVGFVFQSFHLIEDLTALENIALPLELFGHTKPFASAKAWLAKLGLASRSSHFPRQLSGGEQQRIALCRAFAVEPSLLFADEPTANLDTDTSKAVSKQLFDMQRGSGTAMVIATHDHTLAAQCDRIYQLQGGVLINSDALQGAYDEQS